MITVNKVIRIVNSKELVELFVTSSDTKPTNFSNGSTAFEIDTGKVYVFDEEGSEWVEQFSIKEA